MIAKLCRLRWWGVSLALAGQSIQMKTWKAVWARESSLDIANTNSIAPLFFPFHASQGAMIIFFCVNAGTLECFSGFMAGYNARALG